MSRASPAAGRDLVITRFLDAPREVVLRAWTDPGSIRSWWGPHGSTSALCESDVRPGGRLRIEMRGRDGAALPCAAIFHEVAPPGRLAFTLSLDDASSGDLFRVEHTVLLAALGRKTKLTLRARVVELPHAPAAHDLSGLEAGWSLSLDRLASHLLEASTASPVLTRRALGALAGGSLAAAATRSLAVTPNGLTRAGLERLHDMLARHVEHGRAAGIVALIARGEQVHVEALGAQDLATGAAMRRDTIFRIMSMTKPVLATAAMLQVEEQKIGLDDPVDRWLPELADRRVLRSLEGPVDDTVPAKRPITLRDLMTLRLGIGAVIAPPGTYPVQAALEEAGLAPSANPIDLPPDEFMRRLGALPLLHQPGERWLYHTGFDVLAVLLARASGRRLDDLLEERIFAPLGMVDTAFSVPAAKMDRFGPAYARDGAGRLALHDPADGFWARPPVFPSELVSTADDFLRFARMLLRGGEHDGRRFLSADSVREMTRDQLTAAQKAASPFFPGFWDDRGWGFGAAVLTADTAAGPAGQYGWAGGLGTVWSSDPAADLVTILLIQRLMTGPDDMAIGDELGRLAREALGA